jgi:hypothetical protein
MASENDDDQRLVHTLATSLAENLLHHYPNENETPDASQVQRWLNEILVRIQHHKSFAASTARGGDGTANATASVTDSDNEKDRAMVQLVMKEGIQRYKSKQSIFPSALDAKKAGASKSMTFSFLDQWNAGTTGGMSLLDSIITWDRIQQETSLYNKLQLLLKVQHIDDIHPDWDKVCPILLQGLEQQIKRAEYDIFQSTSGDFIKLHETLFEQSRSSPEYTNAQIRLCQNIVTQLRACLRLCATQTREQQSTTSTVDSSTSTPNSVNVMLRRLVRAFWNMWMDWMVSRGGGPNSNVKLVESIGRDIWSCYCDDANAIDNDIDNDNASDKGNDIYNSSHQTTFPSVLMQVMTVEQDPYARWFTSWVAHLPAPKVVCLVESKGSPQLVYGMVRVCENETSYYEYDSDNGNDFDGSNDGSNNDALCRHSLVLLGSILRQTRVSLFPWQKIFGGDTSESSMLRLFAIFLDAINRELRLSSGNASAKRAPDLERIQVCADAMETLLWGCVESDPTMYDELKTRIRSFALSLSEYSGMSKASIHLDEACALVRQLLGGVLERLRYARLE